MDALCHALEAFTSLRQNPYSDSIAIGVIAEVDETMIKWVVGKHQRWKHRKVCYESAL